MSKRKQPRCSNPKPVPAPPDLAARIRGLQQNAAQQLRYRVSLLVQGAASALGVPKDWVFDDRGMVFKPRPKEGK